MRLILNLIAFGIFTVFVTNVLTGDPEKVENIRELTSTFSGVWRENKVSVMKTHNECTEEEKTTWKIEKTEGPVKDCFQYTVSEWLKTRERAQEDIFKMIEAEARPG